MSLSSAAQGTTPCLVPQKLIFSCTTLSKKQLLVCASETELFYSYGPAKKPEVQLTVAKSAASTSQPATTHGRIDDYTYTLNLPDGRTQYQIFYSADRLLKPVVSVAGVQVIKPESDTETMIDCCTNVLVSNLSGIDVPNEAAEVE